MALNSTENQIGAAKTVRKHDFRHPEKLSFAQVRVLGRVNDAVASRMTACLKGICRAEAEVAISTTKESASADLKASLQQSGVIFLFTTISDDARALLVLDSTLSFFLVDRMLGGGGEVVAPERPLTKLERQVVADGAGSLLKEYAQGWSRLVHFEPRILKTWSEELPDSALLGVDRVVNTEFTIKVGGMTGKLSIYLLLPACDSLAVNLAAHRWIADPAAMKAEDLARVKQTVEQVELPLSAVISTIKLPLAEIVGLSAGDILCLDINDKSELQLWTGGKAMFNIRPVMVEGHVGVRIMSELNRKGGADGRADTTEAVAGAELLAIGAGDVE